MEIGGSNICPKDEPDQIGKGEGLAGNSDCHYVLGLPVECPMTEASFELLVALDWASFFSLYYSPGDRVV